MGLLRRSTGREVLDDPVSDEISREWSIVLVHPKDLSDLMISEQSSNIEGPIDSFEYWDVSTLANGFAIYAKNPGHQCKLIMFKTKPVPSKNHSIPTLEIRGVHLAPKCSPTVLSAIRCSRNRSVEICVDSQIFLIGLSQRCRRPLKIIASWVLSK